ncbi:S-adenosylmethionine decarboxylase proenzyme [Pandoraea cepalis]|uniref:S-adenosylmethionine decarboxylase proenzyme n=1 Tax=Pandoraea cepalis TaxID=2508294 RepID=A0A5E4U9W5_9BURK|nr:adenosylmethionine decarboxylase [Pandoraea cepalis]VVD96805.1 S-adenosylmethionine decarboxylase proenzyme [Pandoraea cepalis]
MHSERRAPAGGAHGVLDVPAGPHEGEDGQCGHGGAYGFHGRHVLADLHGLDPGALDDAPYLCSLLEMGIARSGATLVKTMDFQFAPVGVTVLMLLAESHVSLHTYPEEGRAFFDAFTCGDACDPEKILRTFCDAFPQCTLRMTAVMRGEPRATCTPSHQIRS